MNPIIKNELNKVKSVVLPDWDEDTTYMIIPRKTGPMQIGLIENKCYLIRVEDYIIHPFEGFTLHDNWNNGIAPTHHCMKCEIIRKMGKMVKINGVGYDFKNKVDTNDLWVGWLPEKSIKVLEEL